MRIDFFKKKQYPPFCVLKLRAAPLLELSLAWGGEELLSQVVMFSPISVKQDRESYIMSGFAARKIVIPKVIPCVKSV